MNLERPQQGLIIPETISTRAIEAMMSNYRDAQQAFLEIVDNAIDNRIEGQPSIVRIRISKDELSVRNQGGEGLGIDGLHNYFTWGHSDKLGRVGQYGIGGKAAMGFLGKGMEIICSAKDSDKEYKVVDSSWEERTEEFKQFVADERKTETNDGYFQVRISELKKDVNAKALYNKLSDIYRPLLSDGSVKIYVNGKEVMPMEIRYMVSDPDLKRVTYRLQTRLGDTFDARVGVLEEGQRIRPGIRCYYNGRLIEDEQFFGHPDPTKMPGASRLIGEIYLGEETANVTANKSSFIRDVEWESASRKMHDILIPWMEKVAKLKPAEVNPIERYEKDLAKSAKRVLEHVLASTGLLTKQDFPGQSNGILPPQQSETPREKPEATHKPPKEREGATAPTLDATKGETVKRWGIAYEVEIVSMGNDQKRSTILEEGKKNTIKINSDYPLYQVAKRIGSDAQEVYMAETMVMEVCRQVAKERSVEDFTQLTNEWLSETGRILKSRIRDTRRTR